MLRKLISNKKMPNGYTYAHIIRNLAKQGQAEQVKMMMKEMTSYGISVDHNTLLQAYVTANDMQAARDYFDSIQKKSTIMYDTLMRFYVFKIQTGTGEMKPVEQLFEQLLSSGLTPDKFNYTTLIRGYAKVKDSENALKAYERMLGEGIKSDVYVQTSILEALCKSGDFESAFKVFDDMQDKTKVSYWVFVKELYAKGKLTEGKEMIKRMENDLGLKPNEELCRFILEGINTTLIRCANRKQHDEVMSIFSSMQEHGVEPDGYSYDITIRSVMKTGDLTKAKILYQNAIQKNCTILDTLKRKMEHLM
jgi:pentatricopeptide repeat protein